MTFIIVVIFLSHPGNDIETLLGSLPSHFIYGATFPRRLDKSGWVNTSLFLSVTGLSIYMDGDVNELVSDYRKNNPEISDICSRVSLLGRGEWGGFIITSIGVVGYATKNQKLQNTFWLSLESALLSSIYTNLGKILLGRERPCEDQVGRFRGPLYGIEGSEYRSFPSGHASLAFSIGTVIAEQYSDKLWLKILVYTVASGVALSRVVENEHHLSDVLVGSALGFATAKMVIYLH